jgi:hypothetical protein
MFARRYFRRRTVGLEWAAFLLILLVFPIIMFCWDWTEEEEEAKEIEEAIEEFVPGVVAREGSDPRVLASLAEAIWSSDPAGDEFVRWVDLQSYDQ